MASSLDMLVRSNPSITDAWDGKSFGNTESTQGAYDGVIFNETYDCTIQEWTDFTYDAVDLAYGDILGQSPPPFRPIHTPTSTPTTIAEEKGIDKLGEAWTCNIVRAPIKAAGSVLRPRPAVAGVSTTDPTLSSFVLKWKHPDFKRTELDPDWALFDRIQSKKYQEETRGTEKPLVFAVGDSKMWQKWQSAWLHKSLAKGFIDRNPAIPLSGILQKTHDVTAERLKPLEQLATYCRFAETRYGFILTQKEVAVMRVRRIANSSIAPEDNRKLHAAIEYKSIPWNAHGSGKLTVNLAIWVLGCMGMNDAHRAMEAQGNKPLADMVRLTKWNHDKTRKLYRNVISGREISETNWKAMGQKTSIACIDDHPAGLSVTSSFTTASGLPTLTKGVQNMNLGSSTSKATGNAGNSGASSKQGTAGNGQAPPPSRTSSSSGGAQGPGNGDPAAPAGASAPRKPSPAPTKPQSSGEPQRAPSPPKQYIIEGTKGPAFVLKKSGDKIYFQRDTKTAVTVTMDSNRRYYYTIVNPKTKESQRVYLKQV